MERKNQAELRQLRALQASPTDQAAYALALLQEQGTSKRGKPSARVRELVGAALRVLTNVPTPEARPTLLDLYARYAARGETLDPGAYLRAATLEALRPALQPDDVPLLTAAVTTYEFLPPQFQEEAVPLRATALIGLNELDDQAARFHAVRLLADEYTEPMSGEPALTAVRVLGTQGETLPLYYYVMQPAAQTLPELAAECLRNLIDLPAEFVPALVERYGESSHDVVLAGLFDLLLDHAEGPLEQDYLHDFWRSTQQYDAYRYLMMAIVSRTAAGRQMELSALLAYARQEEDAEKQWILIEALSLLTHNAEVAKLLEQMQNRLA